MAFIDVIAFFSGGLEGLCKPSSFSRIVDDIIAKEESRAHWEWGESG